MGPETLYAALTGEPFCLRVDEVASLTDWQIEKIYGHPRNKKTGAVEPEAATTQPVRLTYEQRRAMHYQMGAACGISEEKLKEAWRAKHGRE